MKQFIKLVIVAVFVCAAPSMTSAQKIGHLNVDSLLKIWPAYQAVIDSLATYEIQAQKTVEQMQYELAAKKREIDSTSKTSTELLKALRLNQYKQIEDNLYAYVQLAQEEMGMIQASLVDTLYKQLNKAIADVAKEKGYSYVLDSSKGGQVLYADPNNDVFDLVRLKLKIPTPTPKPKAPAPAPK